MVMENECVDKLDEIRQLDVCVLVYLNSEDFSACRATHHFNSFPALEPSPSHSPPSSPPSTAYRETHRNATDS